MDYVGVNEEFDASPRLPFDRVSEGNGIAGV
jgi:hypothetical protein